MKFKRIYSLTFILISVFLPYGDCIKCFQCSSTEDQRKPTGVWSEDHYTQNRDVYFDILFVFDENFSKSLIRNPP